MNIYKCNNENTRFVKTNYKSTASFFVRPFVHVLEKLVPMHPHLPNHISTNLNTTKLLVSHLNSHLF